MLTKNSIDTFNKSLAISARIILIPQIIIVQKRTKMYLIHAIFAMGELFVLQIQPTEIASMILIFRTSNTSTIGLGGRTLEVNKP